MYSSMYSTFMSVIQRMQICSYLKIFPGKIQRKCVVKIYYSTFHVYPSQSDISIHALNMVSVLTTEVFVIWTHNVWMSTTFTSQTIF